METRIHYIAGRNCETFTNLEQAQKYADKWRDKHISVYKNGLYYSTIHKKKMENGDEKW